MTKIATGKRRKEKEAKLSGGVVEADDVGGRGSRQRLKTLLFMRFLPFPLVDKQARGRD